MNEVHKTKEEKKIKKIKDVFLLFFKQANKMYII